jgi:hypothetical protein
MSKDPVDTGIDLHIAQLLREGKVGTNGPRIHTHGRHPLAERLNLVVEKGPHPLALPTTTVG